MLISRILIPVLASACWWLASLLAAGVKNIGYGLPKTPLHAILYKILV